MGEEDKKAAESQNYTNQSLPGSVIAPGSAGQAAPEAPPPPIASEPEAAPESQPPAVVDDQSALPPESAIEPAEQLQPGQASNALSWSAPEFIAHEKPKGWYPSLIVGTLILSFLLFIASHDFVSPVVILVAGLILGIYGSRKPNMIDYTLTDHTITIGKKQFIYGDFHSFSITSEGSFNSILLIPFKKLLPPSSIYFPQNLEAPIVDYLSERLPLEQRRSDATETLMRRLKF